MNPSRLLISSLRVSRGLTQARTAPKTITWSMNRLLSSTPTVPSTSSGTSNTATITPPEPSKGTPISVKAYYAARSIDITKIPQGTKIFSSARRQYDQRSVIIPIDETKMQHIALFKYGSVVFFNIPEEEHEKYLKEFKESTSFTDFPNSKVTATDTTTATTTPANPITAGNLIQHTEMYKLILHQNLDKPSVIKAEHLNIRSLNVNNLIIIGTIMAQSVALDYFSQRVEAMLEKFLLINSKIHDGNISALYSSELYKLTAANNIILASMLSKMGILEGTDAAWESADYTYTWEELRKDFEIEVRYYDIKTKLELIKDDSRFFLEILQNRHSTKVEYWIIALIAMEVVMGGFQLSQHIAH